MCPGPDWRNNRIQIIDSRGLAVREFYYGFDCLGAKAYEELLNEDLVKLDEEEFFLEYIES